MLSTVTIKARNDEANEQLQVKNLHTMEVPGDSKCFYRSISLIPYSSPCRHDELRNSVVQHLRVNFASIFSSKIGADALQLDASLANDCADALGRDGSWVGEDGILATADYFKR